MQTVAIVGVGLIGASFGLALREAGFSGELIGVSSQPAITAGLRSGAISRSATLEEVAAAADLIYLAQPVDRILETIEILGPVAKSECLITDAGSTKAAIVEKAGRYVVNATFIGGHPMAGKEQRGAEAADGNLFRGRPYVLTPQRSDHQALSAFRMWLGRIGANVLEMSAAEHDRVVAFTSHLPQILSTSLAGMLAEQDTNAIAQVYGPGLLDMTRLAMSSPELWQSIFGSNRAQINVAIDAFIGYLLQLRDSIGTSDLVPLFQKGTLFSASLRKPSSTL